MTSAKTGCVQFKSKYLSPCRGHETQRINRGLDYAHERQSARRDRALRCVLHGTHGNGPMRNSEAVWTAVLSTHLRMLKTHTKEVLYEKYRTEKLLARRATRNIGEVEARKLLEGECFSAFV